MILTTTDIRTPVRLAFATAMLLLLAACGGNGNPQATFDGEECEYSGPESIDGADLEVTFVNDSGDDAALAFLDLMDESARAEEVALIGTRFAVGGAPPAGATELAGVLRADPGQRETQTAPLSSGTYLLDCVTFSAGAPDEVWRVAVLEVAG